MVARLVELYPVDTAVEITFGVEVWLAATVTAHAYPGVWVQTRDGRIWFVTHPGRIRLMPDPPSADEQDSPHG